MKTVRIKPGEVKIGEPLPWAVYSLEDSLLLQKGAIVSSTKQLQVLIEKGIYRSMTDQEIEHEQRLEREKALLAKRQHANPFRIRQQCIDGLAKLLTAIEEQTSEHAEVVLDELAGDIQWLCDRHADSTLGTIHLCVEHRYNVLHPIHSAILCELLGKQIKLPDTQRLDMIMAALSMNVGMFMLQEVLFHQTTPLTKQQNIEVFNHPRKSNKLLEQAGITNQVCLRAVLEHHEKIDGKGYPNSLDAKDIGTEAKIITLADIYAALITPRRHRPPILAREALKSIFEKRGNEVDEVLAAQFIREIGVFPPGSIVRLVNGEIAVVTKRAINRKSGDSTHPTVHSIITPRGAPYQSPKKRDCTHEMFKILEFEPKDKLPPVDPRAIWPH